MYCPQCSQQQVSENVRFCSRCGFSLKIVTALLKSDGALPEYPTAVIEVESRLSRRQKGVRWGALMMLTSFLIALVQALMPTLVDKLVVLAAPVIIAFFIGFVLLLYALFFEEGAKDSKELAASQSRKARALDVADTAALPSAQNVSINDWRRQANTAEMVAQPLSVTEGTTKLLEPNSGALGGR